MRIVCIADTHGHHENLLVPGGDVLVHAGDMTKVSTAPDVRDFFAWFSRQPHRHKVCIAGNHDGLFERYPAQARALVPPEVTYLEDSGCVIGALSFWGSPVQPVFRYFAFNRQRGNEIRRHWNLIPPVVDVLITHGPARGLLDSTPDAGPVGCDDLRARLEELRPRVHIFGHIHGQHGTAQLGPTIVVNASICDWANRPVEEPIVIDLD